MKIIELILKFEELSRYPMKSTYMRSPNTSSEVQRKLLIKKGWSFNQCLHLKKATTKEIPSLVSIYLYEFQASSCICKEDW